MSFLSPAPSETDAAAEAALTEAERVVARLLPLTTPADSASLDLQEHLASAWFRQLEALRELDRQADAVRVIDALLAHFEPGALHPVEPMFATPPLWPWIARALCEKVIALGAIGRTDEALDLAQAVQQRFEQAEAPALREWVARTGLEEARLRAHAGATFARVDMVRHCQALIQTFGRDDWPATRAVVARIRAWQAHLLAQLDYHEEALTNYTALHDDLCHATEPTLQEQAADALHAKARLLEKIGRRTEARAALQILVDTYADASSLGVRQTLALAQADQMLGLALDRMAGAEDDEADADADLDTPVLVACDALLAQHEDSADTLVLRCVNQALRLKAEVLRERDAEPSDRIQADALAERQWARFADHPDERIRGEALRAMIDRLAFGNDEPEQDVEGYRMVLARMGDATAESLQPHLARARLLQAWALRCIERQDEALDVLDALDQRHAQSSAPEVRLQVVYGRTERARILRGRGDHAAALAALAMPTPAIEAPDVTLRKALAIALDLQADLWQDQSPKAHPQQSGKDASGARIEGVVTDAQLRYAEAVAALFERFATDAAAEVRVIVAHAQYQLAIHWRECLQFQRADDAYAVYLQAFAADREPRIEELTAAAYLNHAYLLMMLMDREADALPVYDALIARFANATSADMRDTLAKAAASRLTCQNRLQRQGVAVNYGDQYEDLSLAQRDAIGATIERGRVLAVEGKHREAIACYDEVLNAHVESLHPELRRQCLDAMVRKGYSLGTLAQREAALAVNDEIIARYGDDLSTEVEEDVALAMSNRAVQLDKLGRRDEELQTYDRIIDRWRGSAVAYLKQRVAVARYCKAMTIADTDLDGALALYQQVIDTCLRAPEVAIRLQAAKSTVNRSYRLRNAGRYDEAVACAETLLQACGEETDKDIAEQVVKVRIGLARACGKTGQTARQVETLEALLALPPTALDATVRTELLAEYRQAKPTSTAIGKAAHALGSWFGKKK